jgi:hypothetical protein
MKIFTNNFNKNLKAIIFLTTIILLITIYCLNDLSFFRNIKNICLQNIHKSLATLNNTDTPETLFKKYLSDYRQTIQTEANSGSADIYYNTSYYLNGMLSAIEATKNEDLLKEAMKYIDVMISLSQDFNKDGHLEWKPVDPATGRSYQLYSFQGAQPIARAAAIIIKTPEFKIKYQKDAMRYVNFVDDSIIEFWFDKNIGVYKVADPSWPWLAGEIPWLDKKLGGWESYLIWNDKCSLLGSITTSLYEATNDPLYKEMTVRIGTYFKSILKKNGDGWIWTDGFPLSQWGEEYRAPIYDTSHANRDPMMMVLMYEASIVFTIEDVQRMANTLTNTIWNQSLQDPKFSNYIDGTLLGWKTSDNPTLIGNIYSGWALLGKYSPKAQEVIKATLNSIESGKYPGQNYTSYGKISLSGHILRNENINVPDCSNICSKKDETKCSGSTNIQTCGDYNEDFCMEWSEPYSCTGSVVCGYENCDTTQIPNWYCSNGVCKYNCVYNSNCSPNIPIKPDNSIKCGDKNCDSSETCNSCTADCGECILPPSTVEYCGDKACNSDETCYSCPADCGKCNSKNSECNPVWQCTNKSCINLKQIKICIDLAGCFPEKIIETDCSSMSSFNSEIASSTTPIESMEINTGTIIDDNHQNYWWDFVKNVFNEIKNDFLKIFHY